MSLSMSRQRSSRWWSMRRHRSLTKRRRRFRLRRSTRRRGPRSPTLCAGELVRDDDGVCGWPLISSPLVHRPRAPPPLADEGHEVCAHSYTMNMMSIYMSEKEERANIRRDVTDLATHFAGDEAGFAGWVEVQWARPTGAALDKIVEQLKALKLTMRNSPLNATPADGDCFFTGETAVERILISRTY